MAKCQNATCWQIFEGISLYSALLICTRRLHNFHINSLIIFVGPKPKSQTSHINFHHKLPKKIKNSKIKRVVTKGPEKCVTFIYNAVCPNILCVVSWACECVHKILNLYFICNCRRQFASLATLFSLLCCMVKPSLLAPALKHNKCLRKAHKLPRPAYAARAKTEAAQNVCAIWVFIWIAPCQQLSDSNSFYSM